MRTEDDSAHVIELFAKACEEINEYARKLRESQAFRSVKTGADIRMYNSGWRLEKFIEGELNSQESQYSVWWLELGRSNNQWVVTSNVSISNSNVDFDLCCMKAGFSEDLAECLQVAVRKLKVALDEHTDFRKAVSEMNLRASAGAPEKGSANEF